MKLHFPWPTKTKPRISQTQRPSNLCCTAFIFLFLFFSKAHARELQGRLGLGYNSEFANHTTTMRIPGVSFKYAMSRDLAVELIAGVATSSPANAVTAFKFFKNIFFETNLNFYFMMGGGALSANDRSGAQLIGGLGAEFFIPGIESLGFSMETGASFDNMSGTFILKTLGVSFLDAGIHFYF